MHITTSLAENRTRELWQQFMPRRNEIGQRDGDEFFSVQIMPANLALEEFTPHTRFEKWAGVAVNSEATPPAQMHALTIPAGKYAVFPVRGTEGQTHALIQTIYGSWLPASGFRPDARPQFEIMPAHYDPLDTSATETIWIPIAAI